MLLAIDIGNTDFTIGIFQEKKLCDTFRMRTKINRTSDEYGVFILNTLQYKGSISVKSKVNEGSVFTLSLPKEAAISNMRSQEAF